MRQAYGINGNTCTDCLASCCCPCCALMQMEKEVVSRQSRGNPAAGYVPVQGMSAASPGAPVSPYQEQGFAKTDGTTPAGHQ